MDGAKELRVLALSSYGVAGGAELAFSAFIRHRPPGVEVEVLLVEDGDLRALLAADGVPVRVARGYEGRPGARAVGRFTRELAPLLREVRPDVVWACGTKAALLAVPACRAARIPVVWHKVDFSWDRLLARPLAAAVDGVVAVSRAAAEALGPLRARRLLDVVGVPITLPDALAVTPATQPPAIGTLARLVPYKGLHQMVAAAGLLREEFPDLRVLLAGGEVRQYPGYRDQLVAQAAALGLDGAVELPGFVADVGALLGRLSVFVSATYLDEEGYGREALGAGILEASWAGLPVVASAEGGTAEAVLDGVTGTLVDRPDPDRLAEAIAPYLRDPEAARRAGEAGRAFARERFAPAPTSARVFSALARAAGRTAPPSRAPSARS